MKWGEVLTEKREGFNREISSKFVILQYITRVFAISPTILLLSLQRCFSYIRSTDQRQRFGPRSKEVNPQPKTRPQEKRLNRPSVHLTAFASPHEHLPPSNTTYED